MVTIGLKIEEEMKAKLSKIAKREDRAISSVARLAIEEGLFLFEQGGPHQDRKNLTKVDPTIENA